MDWTNVATIAYLLSWVIFLVALYIIPRNRKPGEATAWLMVIFALPYLGFILFLIFGSPKLSKNRRAMQHTMSTKIGAAGARFQQQPELHALLNPPISERYAPFVQLSQNLGGMPAFGGNSVELLADYMGAVERIIAEIDGAQSYVHLEYFMFCLLYTSDAADE